MEKDYDFTYEFLRFAESLKEPLRTYRVEFNLAGPTGDDPTTNHNHFTSSYSTSHFSSSKTNTSTKTVVYDSSTDPNQQNGNHATSHLPTLADNGNHPVEFSEIRSLKRADRSHDTTDNRILDTIGIVDPHTGKPISVGQAIQMRILDVRTGEIAVNVKGERVSLKDAVRQGLIDSQLAARLLEPGAAQDTDTGRPISLLEVIQKEIQDAETGYDSTHKRIKVTTSFSSSTDNSVAIEFDVAGQSVAEAVAAGVVDTNTGLYRTQSGTLITIAEAYERGLLVRHETVKVRPNAVCLYDAIVHGLVDTSGWVLDRNSGDKFRLDSAIANGLIDPDVREVVDTRNDVKVTLREALEAGILNAKTGRYWQMVTKEKLTFLDAKQRQLICKPLTLKDVCDLRMLEEKNGKIISPTRRSKLSILEAMKAGVLDSDDIKSITVSPGELVSLSTALTRGVILPDSRYRDLATNEEFSIQDAVDRGLISSVAQRSIFNIDGFKDHFSGDYISINQALTKNLILRKSGSFHLDSGKLGLVPFEHTVEAGVVRPEVFEMLSRKVGVVNVDNKELSVIDLVFYELIDPKTGYLLNPSTKAIVPLDHAIESKLITPEGALLLSSLLNITLTTETVTKSIKRYVTITGDLNSTASQQAIDSASVSQTNTMLSFTDAVRQGLIDENQQIFKDPVSGRTYSIQQALNYGLLAGDTEDVPPLPLTQPPKKTTITIVHKKVIPDSSEFLNAERSTVSNSQMFELPSDGWYLSQAIERGLFDTTTGLFTIPGTDRLVSLEECIALQIVNPISVVVLDQNSRRISVVRSFDKRILDATGNYKTMTHVIRMPDAIKQGLIILENPPTGTTISNQRLIQITRITGKPDVVEVSNELDSNPPIFRQIMVSSPDLPSPEPVQLGAGVIYDPSTALVIFTETGRSESILTAVDRGLVDPNLVSIVDPKNGQTLTIGEAIRRGVVNSKTQEVLDGSGQPIDLIHAVKYGLLAVNGSPLVAAVGAMHGLRLIFDPKTGEQIPIELAYDRGLVSKEEAFPRSTTTSSLTTTKNSTVETQITDPNTGETFGLADAAQRGLISAKDAEKLLRNETVVTTINDPISGESLDLTIKRGLISSDEGDNLISCEGATITTNTSYQVQRKKSSKITIKDPLNGEELSVDEALKRRLITASQAESLLDANISDESFESNTNIQVLIDALAETGILTPDQAELILAKSNASILVKDPSTGAQVPLDEAWRTGLVTQEQAQQLLESASRPSLPKSTKPMSEGELTRSRVTTEPTFQVSIGRAKSLSLSPENEGKPVFLQKMRKQLLRPNDALAKGFLDEATAGILQNQLNFIDINGEPITLAEGVLQQKIDGNCGRIVDPQRGHLLTINEAIRRGYLDGEGTNQMLVPLNKSLSLPQVMQQGLLDHGKIVHPETGSTLSLKEAILCEIVDPFATLVEPSGQVSTLESAIERGLVDSVNSSVALRNGSVKLEEAIGKNLFVGESKSTENMPLLGMTFPVALRRGIVDLNTHQVVHPVSHDRVPILDAIDSEFLMAMPYTPNADSVSIEEALQANLIDGKSFTFLNPKTNQTVLIDEAIETGQLVIKPLPSIIALHSTGPVTSVTETVTSFHTITTKTIELLTGFVLVSSNEVQNAQTGESFTLDEAKQLGIIQDESQTQEKFSTREIKINFSDAIKRGLLDIRAGTYTDPSTGAVMPIQQAVDQGILATQTSHDDTDDESTEDKVELLTLAEAVDQIYDATSKQFHDPKNPERLVTFEEAVHEGIVDPKSVVYDIQSGKSHTLEEGIRDGFIDAKTGEVDYQGSGSKINVKEAAKLGLLAVVGAPILAGMAVANVAKKFIGSKSDEPLNTDIQTSSKSTPAVAKQSTVNTNIKADVLQQHPSQAVQQDGVNRIEFVDSAPSTDPTVTSSNVFVSSATIDLIAQESIQAIVDIPQSVHSKQSAVSQKTEHFDKNPSDGIDSEYVFVSTPEIPVAATRSIIGEIQTVSEPRSSKPVDPTTPDSSNTLSGVTIETFEENTDSVRPISVLLNDPELVLKSENLPSLEKPLSEIQTELVPVKTETKKPISKLETSELVTQHSVVTTSTTIVSSTTSGQTRTTLQSVISSSEESTAATAERLREEEEERSEGLDQLDDLPSELVDDSYCENSEKTDKSPDKYVTFELTDGEVVEHVTTEQDGELMSLGEAISEGRIEQVQCRIVYNNQTLEQTVQTALDQGDIGLDDQVQVLNKHLIVLLDKREISFAETLSLDNLVRIGVYDAKSECFVNPDTGDRISFATFAYEMGIVDPDQVYVKDLSQNVFEHLDEALARPLIDKHTGHMVDSKSGKRVPFFECINREWIIQKPTVETVTLANVDPLTGTIVQSDGNEISIAKAFNSGVLNVENVSIRDPASGEVIPLILAIERGIVNLNRGVVTNIRTGHEISITTAYSEGLIITGVRKPISLEAVVHQGLYNAETGRILDTVEHTSVTLAVSISKGIVDPEISLIRDTNTKRLSTLTEALEENLVDSESGAIQDTLNKKIIPLDQAVNENLLSSKLVKLDFIDLLRKQFYDPKNGLVLNPVSGEYVTLAKAIADDWVDLECTLVKDESKKSFVTATEAIESSLIDTQRGLVTVPELTLDVALSEGYLLSSRKPLGLLDVITRNMYDSLTGQFTIDGQLMTLEEAITAGLINSTEVVVRDPASGQMLSLLEAIHSGLVDPKSGLFVDPHSGLSMSLQEATERGILIQTNSKCSLPDAVHKGLYDPKTGTISRTLTSEKISTDRAIKRGIIDPQSTIVSVAGSVLPFELAAERGIVNARRGTVIDEYNNTIDFREAFERGILIEVKKPIRLAEALLKGLYDEETGNFMDPRSGDKMTISVALERGLIDRNSVQIRDSKSGEYKPIDLLVATRSGVIISNPKEPAKVVTEQNRVSLQEAFDTGLLVDSNAPVSLQRAIHSGLYDSQTGRFDDPISSTKITLFEASRKFIINPQLPCYFNDRDEQMLSLADTCRAKIIDHREGLFKEPGSDEFVNLNAALSLGLIVDIEKAGFGLYETLAMGFYDTVTKQIVHPVSGRKMTLKQACNEEIVSKELSLVKNHETGTYVHLEEAITSGLIDEVEGTYVLPKYSIDLQDARHRGLIVTSSKMLSIEKALKNHLYRADNGSFVDPSADAILNLQQAIVAGLLDPDSTDFKNIHTGEQKSLANAVADGHIDIGKGRVLDPKTQRSYNFEVAFSNGLLVTVERPITGRVKNNTSFDVLATSPTTSTMPRVMSVKDAIKLGLIDPHTAVVRHQETFKFIELQTRINDQPAILDLANVFDPKKSFFYVDPSLIIYKHEPVSFDTAIESGSLDLSTGKFTTQQPLIAFVPGEEEASPTTHVLSLRDAFLLCYIDPESALLKDEARHKLHRLPDAYNKGLVDEGNVLDTKTSKLFPLQMAVESGLVCTPKRAFGLLEALNYELYDRESGSFEDPFRSRVTPADSTNSSLRLTLNEIIAKGLVDPSSTVVRDAASREIVPLAAALTSGLVDGVRGQLRQESVFCDLLQARDRGLLMAAKQRQAVIEKFNLCEDNLSGLLKWIVQVEQKVAAVGGPREHIDELRNQINVLKQIKDDIDGQSRPVSACLEQVRQLVLTGGDVLSAPEVTTLENSGRELRSRVDRAQDRTVKLLKKLEAARDELGKLRSELDIFSTWLQTARRTLEDKERALSDLSRLTAQAETTRDFVSDVIAHQADLRFISMSAQKFVDESKDYLSVLNDFRTSLPERLHHVEPLASSESPIRKEVQLVSAQYKDLLHRANALSDRISGLGGRQREYQDALEKALSWLNAVHPRVAAALSDPIAADPLAVQEQMAEAKGLHNDFLAQGRLIDNAKHGLDALLKSLAGQLSPSEVSALEVPVEQLQDRYSQLLEGLGDRCKLLDKALVQSQGVQDALDGLINWVNQTEDKFKHQFRPASLIKDRLQDQIREHRTLLADLDSHKASIESVTASAVELMATASNARIAKKIEGKLQDVINRHQKLLEKSLKRGEFLDETFAQLVKFTDDSTHVETELLHLSEALEGRDLSALPAEELAHRMYELSRVKDNLRPAFENCIRLGKDLVGQRDVTDTGVVRDRVKSLETLWKNLDSTLDEKAKLTKQRAEQLSAYETIKEQVLSWLSNIESRTNALSPVAVDLDVIKRQTDELKPIAKEHRDYAPTIDKINDLGAQYDALIRPDSPARKRSAYSPIKRSTVSPLRRMSGDARSPSPTKIGSSLSPISPGGSSGFGSRRSSQDGFQLADLSPIQQQLNEINNRYSLVGVRLNDRKNELDSLRDEVKKHQDSLKTLSVFLDKIERQLPKETSANKDEADRCTKAARKVLEEMYEKQSLLDSTKAQIKDLLRRKPDVLGADRLRVELEEVTDRWKNLNDLYKDRINFSEQLRDFLDTHDNLNGWLGAKERMLTVLGPISSDPRMVQSQVQQVQVLREEFRGQQPQLNHLLEVGQSVLDYLKPSSPEGKGVSAKLVNVQNKWDELVGRLDERASSLGAAADSSKEFDAGLSRLREALQTISDNLDVLPTDRDHQEVIRKIENLERQLEGQRPLLADAEAAAAALCNVLGDPASRADVNARVGVVGKQYQALQKKLDNRKAETEAALRDGRQFGESCAKTLGWLASELSTLNDRLLVSAHKPTLQHQIDTHEPIYREVMAREHEIIMLLNKGKELQDRPSPLNTDRGLQRDLDKIAQQWERLRREAVERHGRLQTCMEQCKKFSASSEVFLSWLRTAEDKLTTLKPGILKKQQLDQQLKDLQAFRSEVWKRSGEYESTKGLGDAFLTACDVDKEPVKAELQDMRERWEKLNNDLLSHAQTLEICARRLGDFTEELRDLDHAVGRCEDRLSAHDSLGGAAKDPKLLDRVRTIRDDVAALKKPLQSLRKLAGDIGSETRASGGDAEHLNNDVEAVAERIDDLQARLDDRCGELQSAATAVTQFNEQVKNLAVDLSELENAVDSLSPPGREVKVVLAQLNETAVLLNKIDRTADQVAAVERAGQVLVDSGFSPDTIQTREQIAGLRKTLGRLDNRAKDHEDVLQKTLKGLQDFYDIHSAVADDLNDVRTELRNMKPVGSELEQIRNQQDDIRRFRTRTVEPLALNIAEINRLGQELVRSAQGGVSTAVLEKDLERMNEQWNDLKDKLNERERRLDVALLQTGKFQEALDGLAKWLSDTEEMVANQKPPSADYKVVKAQLQEQKFLKKLLLDRQNSMSSLFQLGKDVAANCDPSEKAAIERQLKELMSRFDALTDGAEKRTADLEQAMLVAKQFHDKLVPLSNWLDSAERSVKNMELVPTDEEKIQQRIREHNNLHDEILDKKPEFSQLADIAGQLMDLVGEDEAVGLGDKVKSITERYTNLVDTSDNVGQLLAVSRQGLRHLVLSYQELVAWMESMEQRLTRYRVVPVHTDKLLEQMDVLVELNEDIASKAPNVDSTVETGLELMKHITADEAIQLKDKLDSIQRRYGELTNKGGDLLKNTQEALPIVQKFHDAHNRLVEWMQGAEGALASGEPRESDILRLEGELSEMRPILEIVNQIGPALCQVSPGEGASTIESLVSRDNRRFDAIVEQIQRKAERLHLSKLRSKEVTGDLDELLEWFRDMDATLRDVDPPGIEPKLVRAQLQEHRSVNDDISSQKGRVRDVTAAAKKVLRESQPNDNTAALREKLEDLKEVVETVAQLCAERLSVLEQALPLSEHFADSHYAIATWLDDMENQISSLTMPALRPEQIALQQDKNERLVQSISEQKPLLDKLNKTGEALAALVADDDAAKVNDILDQDNARYAALKAELRERQQALDQALQESSQFSDKLEGMLRALTNTADQVNLADPISAHPPKIRDQIEDNAALVDDLDKRSEAFAAVKRAASDVIAKAGNSSDPAVRDIKKKLEKLNGLWNDLTKATAKRGGSLEDALAAAEKFWRQLQAIMDTLNDLEETLTSQEPAAAQPQEIKKQQVALQEIRQEIDQTKPEVEEVRRTGTNLMSLVGEPDKPEVKKHIEDLDHAWDNITALYAKREENLIDAMEKAMEFHETLQNLLAFLAKAEDRFVHLGPIGSDIDAVKKQIEQLKRFKDDVDPHMVEVEALNRQAIDLTERTSPEQAAAIREPLNTVNRRWEALLRGMVDRQKQLEHALLHLGQFQHALNELLVWIGKTDSTLDQLKPIPGDPQLLEVELAKLKVLANDIQAHQSSVDTLNDAGRQLIETDRGSVEASTTQEKLKKLNNQWKDLLQKASDRQHELEEALHDAQGFVAEVQDILGWLGDVDSVIAASKPVGGLPETASEQLERFMEIFNELEENRPKVESLQSQGQEYIKKQAQLKVPSSNLQHILRTLKQRWDAVVARASDKKIKLEIALKEATEFHDALQAFVDWLTSAEKQLASATSVSRVLEVIQFQIEEHKILQKDVSVHRESMLLLDKKGTHLKYFSQKQDVILIKNLLVSVQHRWERVVAKAAERTRALDHGYKEAREFHESWQVLLNWLQDTETNLDNLAEEAAAVNDPAKIKKHLDKLKETQRNLSSRQGQYDSTMRSGKNLIDRAPKSDEPTLNRMLLDLKETWTRVCAKSIDRQRKLEEALLFTGQFSEALAALLEWLRKTKETLAVQGHVHGDLETVTQLVEQHKHLESDLEKRAGQMEQVLKTGRELERSGDTKDIGRHLKELEGLWDDVTDLSERRGQRLLEALRDAERLHKQVHMLLEWLSEAEQKLRFAASIPDDEAHARELLELHSRFMRELRDKEHDKDDTLNLAHGILDKSYPDAVPIIKNWITIIQSRWEEVSQWALSRESKLQSQLQSLRDLDDTIEELLAWLAGLEATLLNLEAEPLPEEISVVEQLIIDHKEFMENTARRQPDVDRACKPKQQPAGSKDARKPSRSVKTPVRGSSHDLREHSPDQLRKQSFKGSRDQGLNARRTSRVSPSRDTPDRERLPHYGPRFSPPSSSATDVEFRSPRAHQLWDKWRYVWMLAWERQRRLHEHLMYLQDVERVRQFSWDDWRKRFLKFMNHKKSRLTDLFRKMDKDNNGLIPREVFVDGIINTKFDTSRMEMGAVADLFDRNGEGLIDWQEFIAALRPDWQQQKPPNDADKIHDEVKRLVMLCTCRQKFRVFQVGEGKYRFGDSQKLRLVRILRSTVMVRVGGGWVALDEFLVKNDPCRADEHLAELMPIFERLRQQEQIPCAFPLHMGAGGTAYIRGGSRSTPLSPHAPHCHPSTHWVRERSQKSVAMTSTRNRSSLSASTPDSLSDNESSMGVVGSRYTPRKPSYTPSRTGLTPGGSRNGSKPNSRPASRAGSKPPSRHGSTLSLNSADDSTPTRIPQRRLISNTSTPTSARPSRLSVGSNITKVANGNTGLSAFGSTISRPRTPSGSASPAPTRNGGMSRSSSIPTLVAGVPNTTSHYNRASVSRIPIRQPSVEKSTSLTYSSLQSQGSVGSDFSSSGTGRNLSGTSTPSGMQTPRKTSMEPPVPPGRKSRGTTPIGQREPFRL